jgi:phospholipase C
MGVEHVVILMLENRSFDGYFGTFPGANGFYNTPQSVFENAWVSLPGNGWIGPAVLPYRLSTFSSQQGHTPGCNHGTGPEQTFFFGDGNANDPHMNGWASGYPDLNIPWSDGREAQGVPAGNPVSCMGYYAADDIPYHWWLAQNFALCDNYFCSHMGATEANRLYMISGTIGQNINFVPNPFSDLTPTDNPTPELYGGYPASVSETSPPSSWNLNLSPSWPSYADLLTQAAVQAYAQDPNNVPSKFSWRVYDQPLSDTPPDAANLGPITPSILNPLFYWANWPGYVSATTPSAQYPQAPYYASFDTFANDAATAGGLPAVCWIIPNGGFWEHPTNSPWNGAILISRVLEALLAGPNWETTALVVTYDESDGHYDHVPPPRPSYSTDPDEFITGTFTTFGGFSPPNTTVTQQPIGVGFRVPTLVISPWTLNRGVCSDQYDHTSIIQFLEDVTGVHCPNLTNWRRNKFNSLSSIDFSGTAVPASSVPPRPDALTIATNAGIDRYNAAPNTVDDGSSGNWQSSLTASSYVPPMPQQWPPVAQGCQVIMTTPSYSLSQVQDQADIYNTGNTATFLSAFIVTVDGFEPLELTTPYAVGALGNVPSASPPSASCVTRFPQISITDESGATAQNISWQCTQIDFDPNSPANATFAGVPERFTFTYSLTFEDITGTFSFGADTVETLTVNASFQVDIDVTSSAELELVTAQDPQFYHNFYNDTSWLSGEFRVFSIPAGDSLFGVTLGDPSNPTAATGTDALNFITGVINALNANQPPTNTPLPTTEFPANSGQYVTTFDDLNQDEDTNPLSLFQTPSGQIPIFNFALARAHMQSDAPANNVRVFFRSFRMSATDSVYVPTGSLTDLSPFRANPPSLAPPGSSDTRIPLLGIGNVTVSPGQTALEYVTIPFFATVRIQFDPKNPGNLTMLDQQDTPNVAPTIPGSPGSPPTQTFFGCWLDINQNQNLLPVSVPSNANDWDSVGPSTPGAESILAAFTRDTHQCLVAEISFDQINIPAGDTPTSSAWLAQRNLGFTEQ